MKSFTGKKRTYSIRQPSCGTIRFMYYHVARITRPRYWAGVLHASVFPPVWMVSILLFPENPFFIRPKIVFSNLIIPEAVKIHALFKQKKGYMYLLILPGIIKYPGYRLH